MTIKGVAAAWRRAGYGAALLQQPGELFAAALRLPFDPVTAITRMLAPGIEGPRRAAGAGMTLRMLAEPETREQIALMVRDGVGTAKAAASLGNSSNR